MCNDLTFCQFFLSSETKKLIPDNKTFVNGRKTFKQTLRGAYSA